MISITPQGQIYLCKTPLENDYKHQLTFTNLQTQTSYFNTTIQKTFDNYTYIKKDNQIKVGENIDNIINCNYLFYKNNGFTDKYYFCFITGMTYVNENCTLISFETDVFQTYQFDINYNPTFIEREHVNDDTIGLHTVPEGLETGEYIMQDENSLSYGNFYICVSVSEDILRSSTDTSHNFYNGVVSGLTYIILKTKNDVNYLINRYTNSGKIDAINSLFMIPEGYVTTSSWLTDSTGTINYNYIASQNTPFSLGNIDVLKPTILGEGSTGYRPKNNKLLTFPYCYLLADNNTGSNIVYKYENFSPLSGASYNTVRFTASGTINAGCSIKVVPQNYKNITGSNYAESFNGAKLPLGGWINDVYTNWLTQNGVNIAINLAGNVMQIVGGIGLSGTGGGAVAGAGNIASGVTGIASTLGQIYQHSLTPPQAEGNVNSSDIMYSLNRIGATFYRMSIKVEYASIIDKYFTMYGYKVNTVKVPNINGRRYYNYVKTISCNFDGNIPQEDINIIKNMFNNGVTLWHNASVMYNYNVDNTII